MQLTYCTAQSHGEAKELPDLHRLPDEAIERLATCVINDEQRLSTIANQFKRPQCPCTVQVASEFVFVRESIDALQSRVLGNFRDWYERVLRARSMMLAEPAKNTSGVTPQHLYGVVLPARPKQDGCFHLS